MPTRKSQSYPMRIAIVEIIGFLILNLRDYPAWHIYSDNTLISTRNNRDDGLTSIPIPAGHSQLHITYITLPDQIAGAILTLISFATLIAFMLRQPSPRPTTDTLRSE